MQEEIWLPIPEWENIYSVSSQGRVRSEKRIIREKNTGKAYEIPEKILKPLLNSKGYWRVSFSKHSKIKYMFVHRLVAWAFIGKQKKGIEVRHLDGNSQNNYLTNLAYGTKSQNIQDAKKHGTFPLYEKRPGAKLTREIAMEIAKSTLGLSQLAKLYNVRPGTIRQVKLGLTWKGITEGHRNTESIKFKRKFTPHEVIDILNLSIKRMELVHKYNTSLSVIKNIRKKFKKKL